MKFDYNNSTYRVVWHHCERAPGKSKDGKEGAYSDPATECYILLDAKNVVVLPSSTGEYRHPAGGPSNHPLWRRKSLAMALQKLIPRAHHTDAMGASQRRAVWTKFFSLRKH